MTLNLHVHNHGPFLHYIIFTTPTIHNKGGDVPKAPFSFTLKKSMLIISHGQEK